jgi:hypothetical protein
MAAMLLAIAIITFISCKKDEHIPPNITFKIAAGYTSADATVDTSAAILFGIDVQKTEDELKTFDVSVSLDGATATSIAGYPETLAAADEDGFSRDVAVITRNVAGTEKYTFTVTDRDGNSAQKSVTLMVQ